MEATTRRIVTRPVLALLLLASIAALAGCATVYKTLGIATVAQVQAVTAAQDEQKATLEAEVAELTQRLDAISSSPDSARKAAEDVARIEALVNDLQGKLDLLPAEVLARLIESLQKAQAELQKKAH
jgi:cell division protein FtsB